MQAIVDFACAAAKWYCEAEIDDPSQRRINVKKLIFASLIGACALMAAPLPGPQATSTPATKTTKKAKHHKAKKAAKTTNATPAK
jgi:hypothetical protein